MPEMVHVDSTSIEAIGYDVDRRQLFVRFLSGDTYRYDGVPSNVVAGFLAAPSKGSYFNREIKPVYPFDKM